MDYVVMFCLFIFLTMSVPAEPSCEIMDVHAGYSACGTGMTTLHGFVISRPITPCPLFTPFVELNILGLATTDMELVSSANEMEAWQVVFQPPYQFSFFKYCNVFCPSRDFGYGYMLSNTTHTCNVYGSSTNFTSVYVEITEKYTIPESTLASSPSPLVESNLASSPSPLVESTLASSPSPLVESTQTNIANDKFKVIIGMIASVAAVAGISLSVIIKKNKCCTNIVCGCGNNMHIIDNSTQHQIEKVNVWLKFMRFLCGRTRCDELHHQTNPIFVHIPHQNTILKHTNPLATITISNDMTAPETIVHVTCSKARSEASLK